MEILYQSCQEFQETSSDLLIPPRVEHRVADGQDDGLDVHDAVNVGVEEEKIPTDCKFTIGNDSGFAAVHHEQLNQGESRD